ncbi:MAG TPA: NAD(+) diphosphatase [Lacisediminihabitans sp.]|uniref:NAD(+) diphosphatase n=1 Tax=Lacisediminihabitans sp. TaxID=2787631 RepID=UPI002ED9691E
MSLESRLPLPATSLPLSRHELDRDYLSRSRPELLDELWADADTRVLVLWRGNALLNGRGGLELLPPALVPEADLRLYLGRSIDGSLPPRRYAAAVLSDAAAGAFGVGDDLWGNLRLLGSRLDDLEAGLFTAALALANWHASHPFSPRTGVATVAEQGGWVRRDPAGGREVFPRTDAAIIVGVVDPDDRLLLGHNAMWEQGRYSLLAGFVEPGESLESAVVREVFEESGIRVVDPVYLGSQPWPFPASLMLGFTAKVDPDRESVLAPDGAEILDLRWFSREELTAALGEIGLPGRTSIARAIIERWYGGPIDDRIDW